MKPNGGYTFIEIMIALAILIFGIVAIMRMLPIALTEAHLAGEQTIAAGHAKAQLGRIRATGSESMSTVDALAVPGLFTDDTLDGVNTAFNLYDRFRTNIQRMAGPEEVDLKRVVFTVELPNNRRESFVTYVAKQ